MSDSPQKPSFLGRTTLTGFLSEGWRLKNYFTILLVLAFLLPFTTRGARYAIQSNNNDVKDWLPPSYTESKVLNWFQGHFPGEQFALVSWDGCTLGNTQRLDLFVEKLVPSREEAKPTERTRLFKEIMTGQGILDQLTGEPLSLSKQEAIDRLEGALIGPKPEGGTDADRTNCVVVMLSDAGKFDNKAKHRAIDEITATAAECGIPEAELRMGGPPVDNVAIDVEGERTLVTLMGLAGLTGFVLSYLCFRSIKLTMMVFAVGGISAALSLAIVKYFGLFEVLVLGMDVARLGTVDAILMSMPAVVYVLGLSGAIHIVNYYRDARREAGILGAAETAVGHGWKPCSLAAFTTAVGLGSLYISDIMPIKKFGLFTAIGVMGTLALLFTLLPACLYRFPPAEEKRRQQGERESLFGAFTHRVGAWIIRRNGWVFAGMTVLMVVFAYGLTRIETRIQLLKLFDDQADIIHDYEWLEAHLGELVPMEVVLRVDHWRCRDGKEDAEADGRHYRLNMLERMELVQQVQLQIERLDHVGRALTTATFAPNLGLEAGGVSGSFVDPRHVLNMQLEKHRDEFLAGDYLRDETEPDPTEPDGEGQPSDAQELWRISARLAALADVDYAVFGDQLHKAVEPILSAYDQRDRILRDLHAQGKQLRRSRIVMLVDRDEPVIESQVFDRSITLGKLLKDAGAKVRFFNLADVPGDPTSDAVAGIEAALARQDCVVIAQRPRQAIPFKLDGPVVADFGRKLSDAMPAGIDPIYTGIVPLVYKTQRELLTSLVESVGTACVLIAGVMILVLRSPAGGLLAMVPNIFPIVLIFGGMGWLGIKVDIGVMMTASVALGVAVDDTVHFLTWFRDGIDRGLDRKQSVMWAYERCATAMLQTTIIGGLGLSVFAVSAFTPTQQFGILMVSLLSAAILGDLVYLPAMLAGPIGRFFRGRKPKQHVIAAPSREERLTNTPTPSPPHNIRRDPSHSSVRH